MKKKKCKLVPILIYLELIIVSLFIIIPIFWIITSSFTEGTGLSAASSLPTKLTFDNYINLFKKTNYKTWFLNTLEIAIVNTIVSVIAIMVTSWILSRFKFKGKKFGLMAMLLLSMFPTFLSMTAIYILFLTFGLIGKPLALVIIYSIGAIPYNAWLVKGYLDGIPVALDEAAYIDGSSRFNTFFKIILPLSMPIITYCAVSQFMVPWMDYMIPNLLLSSDSNKTLAVGLYSMIAGKENSNFTMFAAGAVLIAIPISIVFMFFQKNLVQGISSGADKG